MRKLIAFLSICAIGGAQTYDLAPLDKIFNSAARAIPSGLGVMIAQNGVPVYDKQFGDWTPAKRVPIASGSKALSAAVIMSLVDSRQMSLSDTTSKYLPYFRGAAANITLAQLLSHTSGMSSNDNACLSSNSITLDQCVRIIAAMPLEYQPGAGFAYNGNDYQVAGRMAEIASGLPFQTLFAQRLTAKLGMTATAFEFNSALNQGPTTNPRIAGGVVSTVADYMMFMQMISQGGVYNGVRILSQAAVNAMLRDETNGVPIIASPYRYAKYWDDQAPANRYGFGFWLEDVNAQDQTTQFSDQGAFGWSPLYDSSRNVVAVIGVKAGLLRMAPYYYQFKSALYNAIPIQNSKTR